MPKPIQVPDSGWPLAVWIVAGVVFLVGSFAVSLWWNAPVACLRLGWFC